MTSEKSPMNIRFRPPKAYIVGVGEIVHKGSSTHPKSLDHFVIYHPQTDATGNYIRALEVERELIKQGYGKDGKLDRVPIFLTANDMKLNIQTFLAYYGKGVCWCRCAEFKTDGSQNMARRAVSEVDPKDGKKKASGKFQDVPCPCEHYKSGACSEYTKFFFQITGFERLGGMSIFRTKSYHTRNSIYSSLAMLSMQLRGFVSGIQLEMRVEWVSKQGKNYPVVHVTSVPLGGKSLTALILEAQNMPSMDSTPAARLAMQGILEDRQLEISSPDEIRQLYGTIEPNDNTEPPKALPMIPTYTASDEADTEAEPVEAVDTKTGEVTPKVADNAQAIEQNADDKLGDADDFNFRDEKHG